MSICTKKINCYITSDDDDAIDYVLLFKSKGDKLTPQWGFLSFNISFEEGNKFSFVQNFCNYLQNNLQGIYAGQSFVFDVSQDGNYWVVIRTPIGHIQVTESSNYDECNMFEYKKVKKLPITDNLQEFITNYPSVELMTNRCKQLMSKQVN